MFKYWQKESLTQYDYLIANIMDVSTRIPLHQITSIVDAKEVSFLIQTCIEIDLSPLDANNHYVRYY